MVGDRQTLIPCLLSVALCLVLGLAPVAHADTAASVASANSSLKRAEDNLKLVSNDCAGGKAPTGSRARLAQTRLDQAKADLKVAGEALKDLPDDGEGVADARKRHAAGVAQADKLQAILTPKPEEKKPAPAPPAEKAEEPKKEEPKAEEKPAEQKPAAEEKAAEEKPEEKQPETVRLDYRQEEQLKGAKFNMREVEGNANALTQLHAELLPVEDQLSIDYRKVVTAMNTIENAKRKAGFAKDALDPLPENGEGVAETKARLAELNKQVADAEAYFKPLNDQLQGIIDPTKYPQFEADVNRLRDLSAMFANLTIFQTDRPQAAAVFAQIGPAQEEAKRVSTAYARLIQQQTEQGVRVANLITALTQKQLDFLQTVEQQQQALPGEIRADLAEADKNAADAVAQQKPLWFTGGIPQVMGYAEDRYALLAAIDPEQAPALRKEIDAMRQSLAQREKSLEQLIIQQNPLPQNNYAGDDRDAVVAVAVDGWKHQQKQFDVLTSRIPAQAWARETLWTFNNGTWYFVDRSKLQVRLILADPDNDKQAVIIPVTVIKDHQKGDTMIGVPVFGGDEKLQPNCYLLRDKIK